ncbi:MAG: hypothetical protein FJ297_13930, partial [Planctomycetes bacterium]|nr:hypothetical protein [Planctomycetota bacterium]
MNAPFATPCRSESPRAIACLAIWLLALTTLVRPGTAQDKKPKAPQPGKLEQAKPHAPGKLLARMLEEDLKGIDEIVFATRVSGRDHWYVSFGYYSCDYGPGPELGFGKYPDGETLRGYGDGGRLCRLNLRSGELTNLIDDPLGGVRDPQVHYSGEKVVFSYRKGGTPTYHLYEIQIDGTGLTQLTDGPDDDIEPTYLPDGGIMFGSSRCRRFVNCWFSRVATLYRCDGDGRNVRMVSSNNDHDNTPWVLPDGRVLYMRWEYVDRSQVHFHHLWTVNPDGTGQMTWYGNEFAGTAMLDAKPIAGTNKIVASFSPGHGMPEHMGHVTVVDPSAGPDLLPVTRQISRDNRLFRDPFAISERCILVADAKGIFVMDGEGNTELVYALPKSDRHMECHEPRPLQSRPVEPVLGSSVDLASDTGELVLADVYLGRNMEGIERGEITKLLVLEQLPEPVHFSGGMEPLSIGGTFTMSRVLGTIPVHPDGSAYMKLPALRSLFFVALDKNDLSVKRMQSFVTIQPGERTSCVGCHEQRSRTSPIRSGLMALQHPPSKLEPIGDVPSVLDFPRDIQPILDKHCVECHNPDNREGDIDLCGDHGPKYSNSYWTIITRGLIADGRNQPYSNRAPRTIGSSASRLMRFLDGSHYDAKPTDVERKTVRLWIDTSATYPGTYAALGCGMVPVDLPRGILVSRCAACHGGEGGARRARKLDGESLQAMCNLTRPEKSHILRAPLATNAGGLGLCGDDVVKDTSDPAYQTILQAIRRSADALAEQKRFDMPGFHPNEHYLREMKRF